MVPPLPRLLNRLPPSILLSYFLWTHELTDIPRFRRIPGVFGTILILYFMVTQFDDFKPNNVVNQMIM